MTLTDVRDFLRTRMDALLFTEWQDGFNVNNIPDTILDKAYHILSPNAETVKLDMVILDMDFHQEIAVFRKGFRNPAEAIDAAIEDMETIIVDLISMANRFTGHLNVIPGGFTIEPLSDDNDNSVKATLNLRVKVLLVPS